MGIKFNVFNAAKAIASAENNIAELNLSIVEHLKKNPKDEKTEQANYFAGHIAGKLGYTEEKARLVIVRPSASTNLEKNPDKRTDAEQKAFETAKTLFTRLRDRAGLKDESKSAAKKESVKAKAATSEKTEAAPKAEKVAVYKKASDLNQYALLDLVALAAAFDRHAALVKNDENAQFVARVIRAARDEIKARIAK